MYSKTLPMKFQESFWMILCMLILLLPAIMLDRSVYATDELILSGIIKSVDQKRSTAIIQITSGSCRGTRTFKTEDPEYLAALAGRKISFRIESDSCKDDVIYTMHDLVVGIREVRP